MIGRLEKTVIDCPDPQALATFYAAVLGMRVSEDLGDWVVIGIGPGGIRSDSGLTLGCVNRGAEVRGDEHGRFGWPDPLVRVPHGGAKLRRFTRRARPRGIVEYPNSECGFEQRLAARDHAHRVHDVAAFDLFEHVAGRARQD